MYCTITDVESYLSPCGVESFADHDNDGVADVGVVEECIIEAGAEIDLYAQQRYAAESLATSTLIKSWCIRLASYFLCLRRGNPPPESLQREFERLTNPRDGLLVQLGKGLLQLPGVSLRNDLRPSMSNVRIDRRYRDSTVRVTPNNSTDAPTTLTQDQQITPPHVY